MAKKLMSKPYVVRFKTDAYILTILYVCFFNKIPLDLVLAMYEKFGKYALFFFKALACKGYVRVSDSQLYNIIESCTKLNTQIRNGEIIESSFDEKMQKFIKYLIGTTEDIYAYEVRLFFDLEEFYSGEQNDNKNV